MAEENIAEMYERGRKAFEWIEFKTQEEVDELVAIVGWQFMQKQVAEEGAKLAFEGSGMGVQKDKYGKAGKVRGILWDMKGAKTCGIIKEDHIRGITTYAKPMGVVANVCPCTNPCITAAFIGLTLLKTRNAMICSPHPRTKLATVNTVTLRVRQEPSMEAATLGLVPIEDQLLVSEEQDGKQYVYVSQIQKKITLLQT